MPICSLYLATVREMTLGEYLVGVVAAEMPAGFPEEALKAQAVAARSYALYKLALYEKSPQEVHHGAQLWAKALPPPLPPRGWESPPSAPAGKRPSASKGPPAAIISS